MYFEIKGRVIKGDNYGKKIGFPTINLDRKHFLSLKDKPPLGIYSGVVILNKKEYKAGIVIGPLDKKNSPKIEAHLLNFNKNIYKVKVIIHIFKFIRKFKLFKSEENLIKQIKKDLEKI